jgi:hypothetical protein
MQRDENLGIGADLANHVCSFSLIVRPRVPTAPPEETGGA